MMNTETREIFQLLLTEIRYAWYEIEELKEFNYPEDKEAYAKYNFKRLNAIEEIINKATEK